MACTPHLLVVSVQSAACLFFLVRFALQALLGLGLGGCGHDVDPGIVEPPLKWLLWCSGLSRACRSVSMNMHTWVTMCA